MRGTREHALCRAVSEPYVKFLLQARSCEVQEISQLRDGYKMATTYGDKMWLPGMATRYGHKIWHQDMATRRAVGWELEARSGCLGVCMLGAERWG